MNQTEKNRLKTDCAWNRLHRRLEQEQLIPVEEKGAISRLPLWKWGVAVAAMLALFIVSMVADFSDKEQTARLNLITQQNTESSTLVTTLEDGSIVYLGGEASLQYPEHFSPDKREVALHGKALFDVAGNRKRPFLIETKEVRVEVIGTAFNIKSEKNNPFELSVQRGKVKVVLKKNGQTLFVNTGETVSLAAGNLCLALNTDKNQFAHYLDNMRFKDEPLHNILRVINLHSTTFQLQTSPALGERKLTVAFAGDTPELMTELICLAMNLKYKRDGNKFTLYE